MDLLTSYTDAVRRNHQRVDAVRPGQLGGPTPCTDWDVRALIGHITGGYQMFAACDDAGSAGADRRDNGRVRCPALAGRGEVLAELVAALTAVVRRRSTPPPHGRRRISQWHGVE